MRSRPRNLRAPRGFALFPHFGLLVLACTLARAGGPPVDVGATAAEVIRAADINPAVPVFVPVHPRIATTISFPRPIGDPVGTGFIDSEASDTGGKGRTRGRRKGDYLIAYSEGDPFFTVQPSPHSEMLNLNVPYEGSTIVLYFYLVDQPLSAVASLVFRDQGASPPGGGSGSESARAPSGASLPLKAASVPTVIERREAPVTRHSVAATPARLDGFLRKLRAIPAARRGAELEDVARAMRLTYAVSDAEASDGPGAVGIPHALNEGGDFQLILLRAARDPALDAVGFIVLFRNTSKREVAFDLRTLSARCGAARYTAQVVDAPARLRGGELRPGYFVIVGAGDGRPGHLLPGNDWRLSIAEANGVAQTAGTPPAS